MTSRDQSWARRRRRAVLALTLIAVLILGGGAYWWFRLRHGRFDLVVCGDRVFDGQQWISSAPCVGVRNGRIAQIGHLGWASTKRRVTAKGAVIAPGFIDLHVHVEQNIPSTRPFRAPNFVRMGVTTLVTGNCGTSARDVGRLLAGLEKNGSQVNVATLVGHNTVREMVMGSAPRLSTPAEVEAMSRLVEKALEQGAFGLSTGLAYAPGSYASEEEVTALARAAARHGGLYATHLRDEGLHGGEALEEALRIGRAAAMPVHISHMKIAAESLWGQAAERLHQVDEARASGMRVSLDAYAYTASSTSLDILMPPSLRGLSVPYRAILKDPRKRADAIAGMLSQLKGDGFPDYTFAKIAYFRDHELEGLAIPEVAVRLGLAATAGHVPISTQAEAVLTLLARGGAQMIYFSMSERDLLTILRHPLCSIGTDSSVHGADLRFTHPRGIGNFPRILGRYVRDQKALSIETALRKMTSLAADTFGFEDRGRIRVGLPADLTVFDPSKVADMSTYEKPLEQPVGISWVFVNGVAVLDPDGLTGANPGRVLRAAGKAKNGDLGLSKPISEPVGKGAASAPNKAGAPSTSHKQASQAKKSSRRKARK